MKGGLKNDWVKRMEILYTYLLAITIEKLYT